MCISTSLFLISLLYFKFAIPSLSHPFLLLFLLLLLLPSLFPSLPPFLPFFFVLSLFSFFLLRFGIKDSETMKFILRFSSFMLSSTLAFQHEMSLKNQNQALLQVAKTLFTSLGVWGWWCVGNCLCGWVGMNVLALFLSAQINPKCCCAQWWQRPKT